MAAIVQPARYGIESSYLGSIVHYGIGVGVSVGVMVGITNGVEIDHAVGIFTGDCEKWKPPRKTNQPVAPKTRQAAAASPPNIPS
jgi:hypothetical protein